MKSYRILIIIAVCICSIVLARKNEHLKEEFEQYRRCLEHAEKSNGTERKIKVVHAIRGSDVILPCFTCVSPEDGIEIDSTYKPSSGTVGRAFNAMVDFFVEKLLKSSFSMADKDKWKYDWEFAMLSRKFVPLSSMHFSASAAISDRIRRFVNRNDAEFNLGDRYELVLNNVDAESTGYYRCINQHKRNVISNIYFLEVSNQKAIVSVNGTVGDDTITHLPVNSGMLEKDILKYGFQAGMWSRCSFCSSEKGEETRAVRCYLEPNVAPNLLPPTYSFLAMFEKIGCDSSLVPIELRKTLRNMGNHVTFVQSRPCFVECTSEEQINRIVNSSEDLGDLRVLDYLPGGEFIFGDILPRLLPQVVRKVRLVVEGDPLILTCQRLIDMYSGVHWYSLKKGALLHRNLRELLGGRAYFDDESNLVFDKFTAQDDDEYFCYSSNNILLGTFHIRVVESDKKEQIIEIVRIFVKFSAFFLIFALIARQLIR